MKWNQQTVVKGSLFALLAQRSGHSIIRDLTYEELQEAVREGLPSNCSGVLYEDGWALIVEMVEGRVYSELSADYGQVQLYLIRGEA